MFFFITIIDDILLLKKHNYLKIKKDLMRYPASF